MSAKTAFTTKAQHAVPHIAMADSRLNRIYRGMPASLGFAALLLISATAQAGPTYLGTAQSFAVLGASTVTNTGSSVITGDLGLSPGLSVTGFPPGTVTGTTHVGDATALQAQNDVTTAYNALTGLACTADLSGQDLGTVGTLTPGVYCFTTSAQLTGTLTLDAQGNPNAVFIFKIGSTLTTASSSSVNVINGTAASSCGVSWQVGSSATLGTNTAFLGNILALTSITLNNGANVIGRALARNGAVTLDNNNVSAAACTGYTAAGLSGPGSGVPVVAATGIPTLSEWAMIMLVALLAMTGFVAMRRQSR